MAEPKYSQSQLYNLVDSVSNRSLKSKYNALNLILNNWRPYFNTNRFECRKLRSKVRYLIEELRDDYDGFTEPIQIKMATVAPILYGYIFESGDALEDGPELIDPHDVEAFIGRLKRPLSLKALKIYRRALKTPKAQRKFNEMILHVYRFNKNSQNKILK